MQSRHHGRASRLRHSRRRDVLIHANGHPPIAFIPAVHLAVVDTFTVWIITCALASVFDKLASRFHDRQVRLRSCARDRAVVLENGPFAESCKGTSWHQPSEIALSFKFPSFKKSVEKMSSSNAHAHVVSRSGRSLRSAADTNSTKRMLPVASCLRRTIPNRDKAFFDQLVASGRCLPWSRKQLPHVRKNVDRSDGIHELHHIKCECDMWSPLDGVIWSGQTPSKFFARVNPHTRQ